MIAKSFPFPKISKIELSWAAGLFDGEGYAGMVPIKGNKVNDIRRWRCLILTISQVDTQVLYRFKNAVGVGVINGPNGPYKCSSRNASPIYKFTINSFEKVQYTIALIWPYLSPVKKAQIKDAMQRYISYKPEPYNYE